METEKLVLVDPKEYGLEPKQAEEVESVFLPVIAERENLSSDYEKIVASEISEQVTQDARELRLKLVKVRTNTDKIHKTAKAFYLAGGRFVDAWKNKNVTVISQMEEKLSEIENYYANIEKERIAKLQSDRVQEVLKYDVDGSIMNLGMMSDDVWNNYLLGTKLSYESRIAAEKKAEEERIENERKQRLFYQRQFEVSCYSGFDPIFELTIDTQDDVYASILDNLEKQKKLHDAEQEKIRLENERLKKQAELQAEKIKAEKEKAAEILRKEREKVAELQRLQREENERIQLEELKRRKAEKEKADNERKLARLPDKSKIIGYCENFPLEFPDCKSQEAIELIKEFRGKVLDLVNSLHNDAENL